MDKDLEKKIKAVERAREVMDMESMHGAEMAQGIEMNEEIEEKLVLIKRLQSKLRFFRGTALAEVILLIIILLYSCGIFEKKEEILVEVPPIEENVPDEYDIFLCADKPDFSLDRVQIYTPSDLINSVDSDFMALSDDCGGAYSYDEGTLYYITGESTKSGVELPQADLYRVDDIVDMWSDLKSGYSQADSAADISFVHSDTKYTCNAWQLYSYENIDYDTSAYWSADINLPAIHENLVMDSQEIVSFQISIIGQDIEEVRSELDYLFDGFEYGRVEKNGEAISYTVNMPSVQADMLFYGGSGVELPEGWTVGYDADADIVVNVHVGVLFYAPEALIGGDLND